MHSYSLVAALMTSPPLQSIMASVTKIFFSYDYANTIANPIGSPHLNVYLDGTTLHVRPCLTALIPLCVAFWSHNELSLTPRLAAVALLFYSPFHL